MEESELFKDSEVRASHKCEFERIDIDERHWISVFVEFMLQNKPCILKSSATKNWLSRKRWIKRDQFGAEEIDLDYIKDNYGEMIVPQMDKGYSEYRNVKLSDYIEYLRSERDVDGDTAKYVKDWHFQRESGTSYALYDLPSFLRFDWINNEKWSGESGKDPFGDYRFVYFGTKNSWTIFHSDVMSSYSWSANICGRKLWYFVPPGNEELFRRDRDGFFEDIRINKHKFLQANVVQFVQLPGEIVFVPSNWYHQVHNLEDTISINHNFINASNVNIVLELICNRLIDVRNEIDDVRSVFSKEEFNEQCQKILKADIRINFEMLKSLVDLVAEERLSHVDHCWICAKHRDNVFECKKDEECLEFIIDYVKNRCHCSDDNNNGDAICRNCRQFMNEYEISCALRCSYLIDLYNKC